MQNTVISLDKAKNKQEVKNMANKVDGKKTTMTVIEGLDGMADQALRVEAKAKYDLRAIPLKEIAYHPENMFGMRDIEKLAESLKTEGQLHNAVVRPYVDSEHPEIKFQLISGERRHRAASFLGWETLYCKVVEADDLETEKMLIVTNLETRELNDIEKSKSAIRLTEIINAQRKEGVDFGSKKTREVVAEVMSKEGKKVSASVVEQLKSLDKLIEEFKKLVEMGEISRETAYQYSQMPEEAQKLVYEAFESGKKLTATEAKELKDKLTKKDTDHQEVINKMAESLKKKEEEIKDFKELADEAQGKVKALENDKKLLEKNLSESQKALNKAEIEKNKALKDIENQKENLKKQLEEAIKAETSAENEKLINDLKAQITESNKKSDEISKNFENEIGKLKNELKSKEEELKLKSVEKNNIEGNKSIQSLAKQAQKALFILLDEMAIITQKEGFEFSEETKDILSKIYEYESEVQKKVK